MGAASAMSAGSTRVRPPDLRREQPDGAAPDQVGQRVDEAVDQVAVLVAPPQQHGVHDVAVVTVDHVAVDGVLDRDPEGVVGVVVPAELLDHHAGVEAESGGRTQSAPSVWVDPPPAVALNDILQTPGRPPRPAVRSEE